MADLRDILSGSDEQLHEDDLMNYLNGNLSEEDKHALEKKINDSQFVSDAIDGLENFKNKQLLQGSIHQLNKNLEKQLAAKNLRNQKGRFNDLPLLVLTAVIILLICILGYFVIHLYSNHSATESSNTNVQQTSRNAP